MNTPTRTIKPLGENAILVEFEGGISEKNLEQILALRERIERSFFERKLEVTNTYTSLLINYPYVIEDLYSEFSAIEQLLISSSAEEKSHPKLFRLPVCYEKEFGWDLELLATEKKLSVQHIIELHTNPVYRIWFMGFLPGFLYLGGLAEELWFPRKDEPRIQVPRGAVGIGGSQTGIYPKSSPGGWQVIGNSPVSLFDRNSNPPSPFSAGDRIRFFPVSVEEHREIAVAVAAGKYQIKQESYEG